MIPSAKPQGERRERSCLADRVCYHSTLSKAIHRSEWRPTLDDAHPFKSDYLIFPSLPPQGRPRHLSPLSSPQAMTALPSFVELMASLGLDNKSSPPPTQELPSPAIVVSSEHEQSQDHISSRIRVARYSPYGAPIVSVATRPRSGTPIPNNLPFSPILIDAPPPRFPAMEQTLNSLTEYVLRLRIVFFFPHLRAHRSTLLRLATGPVL